MLNASAWKRWQGYLALTLVSGTLAGVTALAQQELKAPAVLAPTIGAKQIPLPAQPTAPATNSQAPSKFVPTTPAPTTLVPPGLRSARRDPHLSNPGPVTPPTTPVATPVAPKSMPAKPTPVAPAPTTITPPETKPEPAPLAASPAQQRPIESSAIAAAVKAAPLTPDLVRLRAKINDTLSIYARRHQNTRDNTPWEVMHAFVAFNVGTQIRRDGPNGPPVNAIGWILWGQRASGQPLLTLANGRPKAEIGVGVQGHPGQLTAILAQSRVSIDTPLKIQGRDFTLRDLLEEERLGCRPNTELTFRLIALSHYYDLDKTWTSSDGQEWSIPRIIEEELKAPIRGAACGGTHRLFGLTYAYQQRLKRGQPLDGAYAKAKAYIESYQKYAWSLMNPDGTFSTAWFNKGENKPDVDRKIQTTGHVMEWLILSQSDAELRSPRMIRAMDYLATHLKNDPQHEWKLGPMGHALHTLVMYNERVFGAPKVPAEFVASRVKPTQPAPQPQPTQPLDQIPASPQNGKQQPLIPGQPLPLEAPAAPSLAPKTPIKKPQPAEKPELNPFDEYPEVQVPAPTDAPDLGPAPENLAPPKKQRDQGQEDENSSTEGPHLVMPAAAFEAIDPKSVTPPLVEPQTEEPQRLP
jgi:hypothetical protein